MLDVVAVVKQCFVLVVSVLAATIVGKAVLKKLKVNLGFGKIFVESSVGMILIGWFWLVVSILLGDFYPNYLLILEIGAVGVFGVWQMKKTKVWSVRKLLVSFWKKMVEKGIGDLLMLVFLGLVLAFLWKLMLKRDELGIIAGSRVIWGDWAAHLTYTTSFAYGDNFPLEMPIFAGMKFVYPFLSDFIPALWVKSGVGLIFGLTFSSWWWMMALVVMVVSFSKKFVKNKWMAWLVVILFFCSGGLGWLGFFNGTFEKNFGNSTLSQIEMTNVSKMNIDWINIMLSVLVPQRGFLLGAVVSLVAFTVFWEVVNRKDRTIWVVGILIGLMPLVHAHSFVMLMSVGFYTFLVCLIQDGRRVKNWQDWVLFGLPALMLGVVQIWYFYGDEVVAHKFVTKSPGWMNEGEDSLLWYWVKNVGLMLPVGFLGYLSSSKKFKVFGLVMWAWFLVANVFSFQPWVFDNMKIFAYWYVFLVIGAVLLLDRLWKVKWLSIPLFFVLMMSTVSGLFDVVNLYNFKHRSIRMLSNDQIDMAVWTRTNTKADGVFLTSSNHGHWLTTLAGRKTMKSFEGWLWSYNINYHQRSRDVREMFEGRWNKKAMKEYGVDYVVIGPDELGEYEVDMHFFEENLKLIYVDDRYKMFELI